MARTVFQPQTVIKSAELNANFDGAYDGSLDLPNNSMQTFRNEAIANFVYSGLTIVTSANLTTTLSTGIAYIAGVRTVLAGQSLTFAASKDTYVDVDNAGVVTLTPLANGATTGMALAAGRFRLAKVVTSATAITSVQQTGYDPLGQKVYNQTPTVLNKNTTRVAALVQFDSGPGGFATASTAFVNSPYTYTFTSGGGLILFLCWLPFYTSVNNSDWGINVDGTVYQIGTTPSQVGAGTASQSGFVPIYLTPGSHTVTYCIRGQGGSTATIPAYNSPRITILEL